MNKTLIHVAAWSAVALLGGIGNALADSAQANCEVRKDGNTWKGASGPCTFSQSQGHIHLDLRNGDSYSLVPTEKEGQYRDQRGNKVQRTLTSGPSQEFRWEGGKKITLTFTGGSAAYAPAQPVAGGGSGERLDEFGTVCGVIVGGENYRYRCSATDVYSGSRKVRTTLRYPDQTIELEWRSGNRVGVQFEGMVPIESRYSTSEGETNFVFEDKTYFYYSDKNMARMELQNFKE